MILLNSKEMARQLSMTIRVLYKHWNMKGKTRDYS